MKKITLLPALFLILLLFDTGHGARIKDLADLQGVRENQLLGYGLVVGLNDTGDSSRNGITMQTVANMMEHMGMTLDRSAIDVENVAAVMVTANLPAFARAGTKIDVVVSSVGDAESISGGILLRTPLMGADNNVYAVAQGSVVVGGVSLSGQAASVEKNHPTVGRIPDGALVEREVGFALPGGGPFVFHLKDADFTTITRMVDQVNKAFGEPVASAADSKSMTVNLPKNISSSPVEFISQVENIDVNPDSKARIVVNERTGTIVMGSDVRLSTVAVAHGNIKLTIRETPGVSQPAPFSKRGQTVVVPDTQLEVEEEEARFMVMEKGVSVGDVAAALNAIGVTPQDVISIFQAVKAAGALQAELIVM